MNSTSTKDLQFLPAVVLRTPCYSFKDHSNNLQTALADPCFRTAIYLASAEFYQSLESAGFNEDALNGRQRSTLLKYLNRMHYRPTPFGGFSACSVTEWGNADQLQLGDQDNTILHLGWDQEIVLKLAEQYNTAHFSDLDLHLNPTIYQAAGGYRFINTRFDFATGKISYLLEEISEDEALQEIMASLDKPAPGSEIIRRIADVSDCDTTEAEEYLRSLLEIQFLLTATHPAVTNAAYKKTFLSAALPDISRNNYQPDDIAQISMLSAQLNDQFNCADIAKPKHVFYANTTRKVIGGNISSSLQKELTAALDCLHKLNTAELPPSLTTFKEKFMARYDQQEISLLQALDPDTGIGYAGLATSENESALLTDLDFRSPHHEARQITWSPVHRLLMRKWEHRQGGIQEITLTGTEPELAEMTPDQNLPPSIAVIFRVNENGILLESAGGVTGASIIGRFTAFDKDMLAIGEELTAYEQQTNPEVVFAEISQLSGIHVDNINRRQALYKYEIPVNTVSTLPDERQIALADLYISVKHDRLVLRSKKLNKEVIPRLTSAYNYNRNDLGIFRLLCDLQHQGLQSNLGFDPEHLFPDLKVYPRVRIGNVIISPAKWRLEEAEIKAITANKEITALAKLREEQHWPRHVALTQHDQQLVFDLDNEADLRFLATCLQGTKQALLQEYFLPSQSAVVDAAAKPMVNQFISFLKNPCKVYTGEVLPEQQYPISRRNFALGSEWLYLKLYCNEHLFNQLLAGPIRAFIDEHPGLAHKWFFIRYRDPEPHIRLRLLVDTDKLGLAVNLLNHYLRDHLQQELIREYRSDTYRREIERYGADLMDEVEKVFYRSSELICRYITNQAWEGDYHDLAFITIRDMISCFSDFMPDTIAFTSSIAENLYAEFAFDKQLKISLDQKYRLLRADLDRLLTDYDYYLKTGLTFEFDALAKACHSLKQKASGITQQRKTQLVADVIHMHLNRLFTEKQRQQEMVTYYLLNKHLVAQKARAAKKQEVILPE